METFRDSLIGWGLRRNIVWRPWVVDMEPAPELAE